MNPVTFEEVEKRVKSALNDFKKHDFELLELTAHEQAATHRIAYYLQKYFMGWHVDCEYNRKQRDTKRLDGEIIKPDILIHKRNSDDNLICIEAKKEGEILQDDRIKLCKLTDPNGDFKYQFGLLLILSLKKPYTIDSEWFSNGHIK